MVQVYYLRNDNNEIETIRVEDVDRKWIDSGACTLWFDLCDPTNDEADYVLKTFFSFHPLVVEDCQNLTEHPKIDDFQQYLFVLMQSVKVVDGVEGFSDSRLGAFLGENYLVTYHHETIASIDKTVKFCLANPRAFGKGPDNIFHLIIDDMVDEYIPVLDTIDALVDGIEDEIFQNPKSSTLNKLITVKKEIMRLRRVSTTQKEILNRLSRGEFDLITQEERIFYRDVYDHLVRISDLAETYRDLVTGSLEAYLSVVSNKMNEVMKTLTIISTLMLPLTFIAGVYGMNFHLMPEISWTYGYPVALAIMLLTALGMLWFFKRRKWF